MHKKQFNNNGTFRKPVSGWQLIFKSIRRHRRIRYSTDGLIKVAKRIGNFELNKEEKNTLYKNTVKMIQNYHSSSKDALRSIGEFWTLCKVDIFEMQDKNKRNLAAKLIRKWPLIIEKKDELNEIINMCSISEKEEHKTPSEWIFKQVIEMKEVKLIFQGSLGRAARIL